MKIAAGFLVAFALGAVCRVASFPLPAPPFLLGALLVVSITAGYVVVDRFSGRRADQAGPRHGRSS